MAVATSRAFDKSTFDIGHYKLAAIDLDGTLLGPDRRISRQNKEAVMRLKDAGLEIVIASGRRHEDILRFHKELGLTTPVVSCHGAMVRDVISDRVLSQALIPLDTVCGLIEEAHSLSLSWIAYDQRGVHLSDDPYWLGEYIKRTAFDRPQVYKDAESFTGAAIAAEKLNWMGEPEMIMALFRKLEDQYRSQLTLVVTDPDHLEFTAAGADKAFGLARLGEVLGIRADQIMTFGDSNNDAPMLAWAGLGVAMTHGTAMAREAADLVSPPGEEHDSLARAIDYLLS